MTVKKQPEELTELTELDALREPEGEPIGDYDPAQGDAEKAASDAEKKALIAKAQASAMMTVAIIEGALKMVRPDIVLAPDSKAQVAEKLAPVLVKYQAGGVPPWVAAYREELELAGALALVGFGVWQQMKMAQAKEVTEAVNGEESSPKAA